MSVQIVIPREEIESYVWNYIIKTYGIATLSDKARKEINTAVKVLLSTNKPIEYARGVCGAFGVLTRECILNATAKYVAGWLEDFIIRKIIEDRVES